MRKRHVSDLKGDNVNCFFFIFFILVIVIDRCDWF